MSEDKKFDSVAEKLVYYFDMLSFLTVPGESIGGHFWYDKNGKSINAVDEREVVRKEYAEFQTSRLANGEADFEYIYQREGGKSGPNEGHFIEMLIESVSISTERYKEFTKDTFRKHLHLRQQISSDLELAQRFCNWLKNKKNRLEGEVVDVKTDSFMFFMKPDSQKYFSIITGGYPSPSGPEIASLLYTMDYLSMLINKYSSSKRNLFLAIKKDFRLKIGEAAFGTALNNFDPTRKDKYKELFQKHLRELTELIKLI